MLTRETSDSAILELEHVCIVASSHAVEIEKRLALKAEGGGEKNSKRTR